MNRYTPLLLSACALTFLTGLGDIPSISGGNRIFNSDQSDDRYQAIVDCKMTMTRFEVYSTHFNYGGSVSPSKMDSQILDSYGYGIKPILYFHYFIDQETKDLLYYDWYQIGRQFAERFRPNSSWLKSQGINDWGVTQYQAINEPDGSGQDAIDLTKYHDALEDFANGVHSIDSSLKVMPGGFARAQDRTTRYKDCVGVIADLLQSGSLDGIDLHTYIGYWQKITNYDMSSQATVDFTKDYLRDNYNVTRNFNFYSTEYNVYLRGPNGQYLSDSQAADWMLTLIWDTVGVVDENENHITKFALPYSLADIDAEYGLSTQLDPWIPNQRGEVVKMVMGLTKGMEFTSLDPRDSGIFTLEGGGKKMWVWQNRSGWTDRAGTSFTVSNIPVGSATLEVYDYTGNKQDITLNGQSSYTVNNLNTSRTYMFLAKPADEGLLAHYRFNYNFKDSSKALVNDGIGMASGFSSSDKMEGSHALWQSSTGWVNVNSLADDLAGSTEFTICGWVKRSNSNDLRCIFGINTSSGSNRLMITSRNGKLQVYDVNQWEADTGINVLDNTWHHIAYTRNGSTGTLFIDGESVKTHSVNYSHSATDQLSIGQEFDGSSCSDYFQGKMDDFRIYNRALTEDEIQDVINDPAAPATAMINSIFTNPDLMLVAASFPLN